MRDIISFLTDEIDTWTPDYGAVILVDETQKDEDVSRDRVHEKQSEVIRYAGECKVNDN
jgi:hypothetical protein